MWFPLVGELPGRAVLFHLLPLREAYGCLVAMGITKGWLALSGPSGSPEREDVPLQHSVPGG